MILRYPARGRNDPGFLGFSCYHSFFSQVPLRVNVSWALRIIFLLKPSFNFLSLSDSEVPILLIT